MADGHTCLVELQQQLHAARVSLRLRGIGGDLRKMASFLARAALFATVMLSSRFYPFDFSQKSKVR